MPDTHAPRTVSKESVVSGRRRITWALVATGILAAASLMVSGSSADVSAPAGAGALSASTSQPGASTANPLVDARATPPLPADQPVDTVESSAKPPVESTAAVTSAPPGAAMPAAAAPIGLRVEAAGIDVAVLALAPTSSDLADQSIVPPFTDDGYWLASYGAPGAGSTNTTYIVGHSWEGREAPFDRFSSDTSVGDRIEVATTSGTVSYIVDSITTHDKDTLRSSDIWNVVPHRLVIISCYTEDPWGKNVVIIASPTGD